MTYESKKLEKLQFGKTYHIFNRAIGNEKLFVTEKDYYYFLQKIKRFIMPFVKIYSYCLIPNHFHLLVSIKEQDEIQGDYFSSNLTNTEPEKIIIQKFSDFFNSYSKSYNKAYNRKGRLFLYPFKHIEVTEEDYLFYLISYIHRNPIHHGLTNEYTGWKYSSYNTFLTKKPTDIERGYIIDLFGSIEEFVSFHKANKTKRGLKEFIVE